MAIPKGRTVWGHPVAVGPSKEFVSVLIRERERERERERHLFAVINHNRQYTKITAGCQ